MTVGRRPERSYLQPYHDAARVYGAGFGSLLWASPQTQAARFEAIRRLGDLDGKSVLDVGCGRADLLDHLLARGVRPADYIGIEAVEDLAAAAEAKRLPGATIVRADFVAEPVRLFVGADVVVFSGSLNTADDSVFYPTLARAWDAAAETLVFNFLCSPMLAGRDYLFWRRAEDVLRFARGLAAHASTGGVGTTGVSTAGVSTAGVSTADDYLPGDMTVRLRREDEGP